MTRRLLTILGVVAAALMAMGAVQAHNDDCLIAIHVGGIQVHPACG